MFSLSEVESSAAILDRGVFLVVAMIGIKVKAKLFVTFDSLVHLRCLTNFKFRLF